MDASAEWVARSDLAAKSGRFPPNSLTGPATQQLTSTLAWRDRDDRRRPWRGGWYLCREEGGGVAAA